MGALSRLAQNSILDVVVGRSSSWSTSGQVWAQLHTGGSPGVDGTANVAPGFSRQQVSWGTPASRRVITTSDLLFSSFSYQEAGSPYVSFWDAASGGNFLGADQATPPEVIDIGQSWKIPAGELEIKIASTSHASDTLVHRILSAVTGASSLVGSGTAPYMQLHTGDPGVDGTSNVASGVAWMLGSSRGAGRMQTPSWPNPAANGQIESAAASVPHGWEVRSGNPQLGYSSYWDAATGGNYLGRRGTLLSNLYYPGDRFEYFGAVVCRFSLNNTF